ncbi:DUF58 domain-containing protein [Paenibacillus sp. FSL R7-0273]|uniref:DUF58 domain-containing protein n=1 Tax=Paenibacillus sp. FSL R7-0273 TaxID=1536772 RepID=UPI0006933CDB|nr:DUF58 domain-containing protein [Paenibacillus sp. FSL R7-0273]OMF85821.1 hypothetical protein BK144_27195 [Paenibacillus sp. FSL R7-0273]
MSSSSLINQQTTEKGELPERSPDVTGLLFRRGRSMAAEWIRMLAVTLLLGGLYIWRGGASLLFLLTVCGLLMAGGFLLQAFGPRRFRITRSITPVRPVAGDSLLVEVQVSFAARLPLPWMIITDYWGGSWHRELLFPGFRRSFRYSYRLHELPRGVYQLHGSRITWGDPAGLFTGESRLEGQDSLKVLPRPLFIGTDRPESGRHTGDVLVRRGRGSSEAADIRNYMPGDPLNRIHWKSSASKGMLQSRVPEKEEARMSCIVLANSAEDYEVPFSSLSPRSRRNHSEPAFERAVSAAMGLMLYAERSGAYVQLFTGGWPEGMARHEGLGKIPGRVQELLTEIRPGGTRSLSRLLEDASQQWIPGMTVAVITGRLEEEAARVIARFLVQGVKVELYYVWDQAAPLPGGAAAAKLQSPAAADRRPGECKPRTAGTVSASLARLGARVYCLDYPDASERNKEAEAHEFPGRPTMG